MVSYPRTYKEKPLEIKGFPWTGCNSVYYAVFTAIILYVGIPIKGN